MPESTLEPIGPDEAVRLYLNDRGTELASATINSYRHKLNRFIEWCEAEGIENINELTGRKLLEFKQHRSQELTTVSLKGQLDTLRSFLRFAESIDAVEQDLHNKILSPSLNQGDKERDVLLDTEILMMNLLSQRNRGRSSKKTLHSRFKPRILPDLRAITTTSQKETTVPRNLSGENSEPRALW